MLSANALALTKCVKRPCMVYEKPLDKGKIEERKLTEVIDDIKKTKQCPAFDGDNEIEGLLYTEERYRKVAKVLQFNTGVELYDNFEELLTDSAEEHWTQITRNTPDAARTVDSFNQHMESFYTKYVDDKARNIMFKYLPMLKKPRNAEPAEHVKRMQTLCRYSNKLPGTVPVKSDEEIKELIFDSFPDDWTTQYNRSGRNLQEETMAQVLQFMKDEKNYKDNEDTKRKSHPTKKTSNNGSHSKRRNEDAKRDPKRNRKSNPCKYHNGHHDWYDCIFNPRSKNFKPDRQRPSLNKEETTSSGHKPGGYRQGPHYYTDGHGRVPPSFAYLPPVPSTPPIGPPMSGSVPSSVSFYSSDTNGTKSGAAPHFYVQAPPGSVGWR